jgi:hypothetical protein
MSRALRNWMISSVNVSHSLHCGHRPSLLEEVAPQLLQTYRVLTLLILVVFDCFLVATLNDVSKVRFDFGLTG